MQRNEIVELICVEKMLNLRRDFAASYVQQGQSSPKLKVMEIR